MEVGCIGRIGLHFMHIRLNDGHIKAFFITHYGITAALVIAVIFVEDSFEAC